MSTSTPHPMKSSSAMVAIAAALVGLWSGTVTVQAQTTTPAARARAEVEQAARQAFYQLVQQGDLSQAWEQLQARPAPRGVGTELFYAREWARVSFSARNSSDWRLCARAGEQALIVLSTEQVRRWAESRDRVAGNRLAAKLYEYVVGNTVAARQAWADVLMEKPDDEEAKRAIRRLDNRRAVAKGRARRQARNRVAGLGPESCKHV